MFITLVLTGIRRGELQGLRWRDVDLIRNVLRVTDSKTEEGIRSTATCRGRIAASGRRQPLRSTEEPLAQLRRSFLLDGEKTVLAIE